MRERREQDDRDVGQAGEEEGQRLGGENGAEDRV